MTTARKFTSWKKSSFSSGGDNCVEVAFAADGSVGVRDSKQKGLGPIQAPLTCTYAAGRSDLSVRSVPARRVWTARCPSRGGVLAGQSRTDPYWVLSIRLNCPRNSY